MDNIGIKNHFILGTAGHVDHGKTSLIKSLTGIDCDTHPEEKLRGITINLGFAHLEFADGTKIGIVDVPGHKDFINTMISGACAIDLLMLVIAADSGVMPQTVEHLQIAQLLGIKHGILVITKVDLADDEMLMIVEEDIAELTKDTFLSNSQLFKVSSKNGDGIDELKNFLSNFTLDRNLKSDETFRMYIDRIFSVAGFGTVVTGSVLAGMIKLDDKIFLLPSHKEIKIRRLEQHGKECALLTAGNRAAINLSGIKCEELSKGMVLSNKPINSTEMIDAQIKIINAKIKMSLWSNVIFLCGTFQCTAKIHLLDYNKLKCNESALVQIHLSKPLVGLHGDKFILRNSSGDLTIGGGEIIDPYPLHHKRRKVNIIKQLKTISEGNLVELVATEVRKYNKPLTLECVINRLNISLNAELENLTNLLPTDISLFQFEGNSYLILVSQLRQIKSRVIKKIENHHKLNPLDESGKTFEELMGIFSINRDSAAEGVMKYLLNQLCEEKVLKKINGSWSISTHEVKLTELDLKQIKTVLEFHKNCGMNTPLSTELIPFAYKNGISEIKLDKILTMLTKQKKLYCIDGNYIFCEVVDQSRNKLLRFLAEHNEGITVAGFRDLVNGNRKICLLLLARFDREGITLRENDLRFITSKGMELIGVHEESQSTI